VSLSGPAATADDWFKAWHNSDQWDVVGNAALDPGNPKQLVGKPGVGALVNGREGRRPSLVTKRGDYRDVEVHVEFMVARYSNSGVIFHGNHEIQIRDTYGVEDPALTLSVPKWRRLWKSSSWATRSRTRR
jgi:hypothetical protein